MIPSVSAGSELSTKLKIPATFTPFKRSYSPGVHLNGILYPNAATLIGAATDIRAYAVTAPLVDPDDYDTNRAGVGLRGTNLAKDDLHKAFRREVYEGRVATP